ncbi:hypothetical protein [Paenibacillus silvae]|uniref:nucleotide-binding protein n=1 Tax=Paenibacillus silvae TaxID=1325358 RepID=UPI0020052AAA|nr:hypothetical protein [Paenibacillus silvae]MCK6074804.1 hypothetical protein [Paenibacillus silvae]MCK6147721.1 hypothetical protein [Paenibacillus silvae]MCK6266019.1 hypothetical protein [Paenibacillus silvae]
MCFLQGVKQEVIVLKVVLVSRDKDYLRAWLDYVQRSSSGSHMRFIAFSEWEAFSSYMLEQDEREMPELLVAEPEFLNPWLLNGGEHSGVSWLLLSEGQDAEPETKRLMKYQPLPVLLEAVRNACRQPQSRRSPRSGRNTLSIAVVSASGGSGKTAVSLHLAKQLGLAGYSVLYLNLETMDSSFPFLEKGFRQSNKPLADAETGLSRLLYDLKARRREVSGGRVQVQRSEQRQESGRVPAQGVKEQVSRSTGACSDLPDDAITTGKIKAVEAYVMRHETLKSDVFWPLANRKEMLQMSKTDTTDLIRFLVGCGQYEVLILDGDSGWDERSEGVLENADMFIWLVKDDLAAMHRWGQWLQHAERTRPEMLGSVLERTYFVINEYREQLLNSLPRADLHVDAVLPYIPSWKQLNQEEVMLSSPIFQREVKRLCDLLLQFEEEERRRTGQIHSEEHWA